MDATYGVENAFIKESVKILQQDALDEESLQIQSLFFLFFRGLRRRNPRLFKE